MLRRILIDSSLLLVFSFLIIAPPAFSAVLIKVPVEKDPTILPQFSVYKVDEGRDYLEVGKAREGSVWAIPLSYVVQPSRREHSILTLHNGSDLSTAFRLTVSDSSPIRVYFADSEMIEQTVAAGQEVDLDLVAQFPGKEMGQRVSTTVYVEAIVR